MTRLVFVVLGIALLVNCAGKPKLSKKKLSGYMEDNSKNADVIEDFEKNHWRLYELKGHGDFTGKELATLFQINDRCLTYYKGARKRVFRGDEKYNPAFVDLSSDTVKEFIGKYKTNMKSACTKEKVKGKFKRTDISGFYKQEFYDPMKKKLRRDMSRLEALYNVKRREELGYK